MSSALPACCLEAAGGGPCIPLASRIPKDRSKPWQGTARANYYVFHGGKYRNWDEVSMANAVEKQCDVGNLFAVQQSCISESVDLGTLYNSDARETDSPRRTASTAFAVLTSSQFLYFPP